MPSISGHGGAHQTTNTSSSGLFAHVGITATVTQPDSLCFHNISDEQLEMFEMNDSDGLAEPMWSSLWAAIGAAPGALNSLQEWINKGVELTLIGLLQILIVCVGIALFFVYRSVRGKRTSRTKQIVDDIRAREKKFLYVIGSNKPS